jgi:hypothetical protein
MLGSKSRLSTHSARNDHTSQSESHLESVDQHFRISVSLLVLPENIDLSLSSLAAIPGHLKLLPQRLDLGLELGHLVPVGES